MPITCTLYTGNDTTESQGMVPWAAGWSQMCKITCYALISIVIARRKVVMEEAARRETRKISACLFFIGKRKLDCGWKRSAPVTPQPVLPRPLATCCRQGIKNSWKVKGRLNTTAVQLFVFRPLGLRTPGVIFQVNNEALS